MKLANVLTGAFATVTLAQSPAPYTDLKSGITFNTFQHTSGYFFGLALPQNNTGNTDFIATIGGKGTGYSGVSFGGGMLSKLLFVAWPNQQSVVSSFRKTANYGSPAVAAGTFTQTPIANGTYVNSTHWTYTFLCSKCIQSDGTTFKATDSAPSLGWVLNAQAPAQRANAAASVSKHSSQGQAIFDLSKARSSKFETWKSWAKPAVAKRFDA
ncbi:hypothetical protein BKA63DRAFT_140684 [Paraphoma chrysanthemicola]|nr:hypothetical protein BKA63DRAFT_140684 [Paraphoma chrysanthemicola]